MMVLHFLANIAAAIEYIIGKSGSVRLCSLDDYRSRGRFIICWVWSVFYMVLPLAILGYLIQSKQHYFE